MNCGPMVLNQLVLEHPKTATTLHSLGLDFCCRGHRTVSEACESKGLDINEVNQALEAAMADVASPTDFDAMSLQALIDHVLTRYHEPQVAELERLMEMFATVARVHGSKWPVLLRAVGEAISALAGELFAHFRKEEMILFPMMLSQDAGTVLENAVARMLAEHDTASDALDELAGATNQYVAPTDGCATSTALWRGLREIDLDIRRHVHFENAVLFPRALEESREA